MVSNRQPELYAAALIPYTAAAVALVLRMFARRKTRMPFTWEDYVAVIAFVSILSCLPRYCAHGYAGGRKWIYIHKLVQYGVSQDRPIPTYTMIEMRWGLGVPIREIDMPTEEIIHHYFLDLWADMWLYTFSVGLSKFVILGLYWRMFSVSVLRQPIRILFACSMGWLMVRVCIS